MLRSCRTAAAAAFSGLCMRSPTALYAAEARLLMWQLDDPSGIILRSLLTVLQASLSRALHVVQSLCTETCHAWHAYAAFGCHS